MKKALKDYFTFSSRERTGMIVMVILVILAIAANCWLRYFPSQSEAYDYSAFNSEIERFRSSLRWIEPEAEVRGEKTSQSGTRYYHFNHDTLMGKGRVLPPKDKENAGHDLNQKRTVNMDMTRDQRIEINTADSSRLKKLRGIGPVLASRIIKYRLLLGGYHSIDQLTEVYGVSDSLFLAVREHLDIDTSLVQKISINGAGEAQLSRHPYIGRYRAKAILAYRKSEGFISGMEELVINKIIPAESCERVGIYLDFSKGEVAADSSSRQ
jgi:competence protein ComEA